MSTPVICNREPSPWSTANVGDSSRCSVRSRTRIDRSKTLAYFGSGYAWYGGSVLPENHDRVQFNLEAFIGAPKNPVTRSIELDNSLKITKSSPSNQEGLYFFGGLQAPMDPEEPLMFQFVVGINTADVVQDTYNRSGVMAGFMIGDTGLTVQFMTDGVTRWIELWSAEQSATYKILHPATTYQALFDWGNTVSDFKVLWHPAENKVRLYRSMTSPSSVNVLDQLLIDGLVSDFPTLPLVEQRANQPWAFFGHGAPYAKSISSWYFTGLMNRTATAIYNGIPRGGYEGFIQSDNTTLYDAKQMTRAHDRPWNSLPTTFGDLAGTEVLENDAVVLTKSEPTKSIGRYRVEPRLQDAGVVFDFTVSGDNAALSSEVVTGIEVFVNDGVRSARVAFLSASDTDYVGVLTNAALPDVASSYNTVLTSWHTRRAYRLQLSTDGLRLKTIESGEENLILSMDYTDLPLISAPGAGVLPSPALGVVLDGRVESRASIRISRMRYSLNMREQESAVPVSPWVYVGPSPQSSYVSATGAAVRIDGSLSSSIIRFDRAETMYSDDGVSLEFRAKVESYKVGTETNPVRETTGVGVSIEDTTRQIALVFADAGPGSSRIVFFARTTNWDNDLLSIRKGEPSMSGRYTSVDWTSGHIYRVERTVNGKLELYLDDVSTPAISLDDAHTTYPIPPGGPYVRFGTLQANRFAVSEWQWLRYSVSNGFDLKVFPSLTESEMLDRFDTVTNLLVETEGV